MKHSISTIFRAIPVFIGLMGVQSADATVFTVNSPADIVDSTPGDGICETATGNGVCTLRAAVMESNGNPGSDTINLQDQVTYLLTQSPGSQLTITDSVSIAGAGVDRTIIDGNNAVVSGSVFLITKCLGNVAICDAQNPPNVVSISNLTIRNGGLSNLGGGIFNQGNLTIDRCTLTHNKTFKYGAGIYNGGTLVVNESTISENDAGSSPGGGGGVASFGTTIIRNSTLSANIAVNGGGIYSNPGTTAIINSTLSGNYAKAYGGGIALLSGTTSLFNSTVAFNQASAGGSDTGAVGGGVFVAEGGTLNFINSIIAPNEYGKTVGAFFELIPDDCAGTITSQGNNIVEYVDSGHCIIAGSVNFTDPQLGPLQDNGGPTQTQALAITSPAIDAGNMGGCTDNLGAILTTDQRGVHRPSGQRCDIGAFESTERVFSDGFEL